MISHLVFYTCFEGYVSLTSLSFKIYIFFLLEAGNSVSEANVCYQPFVACSGGVL